MGKRIAALVIACSGCGDIELPISLDLVLPADESDLTRTNNVSLTLQPRGSTDTFVTDGLDFSLVLSLPPQRTPQTISIFLAEDERLLAWGRTPAVPLAGESSGLSLLVARPDQLSTFDAEFDAPDPDVLAAAVGDVGMLAMASDGTCVFLDAFGWDLRAAAPLPSDAVPDPSDGALVADPAGGVQRIAIAQGLVIHAYSPVDDAWTERELDEDSNAAFGERPNAALRLSDGGGSLWVLGGGEHRDVVSIELSPDAARVVVPAGVPGLDAPRPSATATLVARGEGQLTSTLLFGSADDRPIAWLVETGTALGPAGPWIDAACIALDEAAPARVLCVGGTRDGEATADAAVISIPMPGADETPTLTELPDLLDAPLPDPLLLPGRDAVYAQGEARQWSIERAGLVVEEAAASPVRARGGRTATLDVGVTFLVGGVTADGAPLPRWLYFAPQPG